MRRNAETTVTSARPRTIGATTLERLHSDLKELGNGDGGVGELQVDLGDDTDHDRESEGDREMRELTLAAFGCSEGHGEAQRRRNRARRARRCRRQKRRFPADGSLPGSSAR